MGEWLTFPESNARLAESLRRGQQIRDHYSELRDLWVHCDRYNFHRDHQEIMDYPIAPDPEEVPLPRFVIQDRGS